MENPAGEKYISFSDIKKNKYDIPDCIRDLFILLFYVSVIMSSVYLGIWVFSLF